LNNKVSASPDESLGQQFEKLWQVVEQMRIALSEGRSLPDGALQKLEYLSSRLKFIGDRENVWTSSTNNGHLW
jgi:hypothetical protein